LLNSIPAKDSEFNKLYDGMHDFGHGQLYPQDMNEDEGERDLFVAWRYARFGDRREALERFTEQKKVMARKWNEELDSRPLDKAEFENLKGPYFRYLYAAAKGAEAGRGEQSNDDRRKWVQEQLEGVRRDLTSKKGEIPGPEKRRRCRDIIALYHNSPGDVMPAKFVDEARALLKELQ
jgi:hypothetical protein